MIRRLFRFVLSFFFWICASIGFVLFILLLTLYWGHGEFLSSSGKSIKHESVLSLSLHGSYAEYADATGLESLVFGKNASLYHITRAIYEAAKDEKIKGIVVRIDSPSLGTAQLQEVRDALLAFRKTGKPSWCYADSFGESSSGTSLYYLATACEEIWLQPMGLVNLVGVNMQVPFAKQALEKLNVKPEIAQRKEYKSFIETFTRDDFSDASREAEQAIADSILSQFVDGIAKERKISHDHVRQLINNGPYLTEEALAEKLIDRIHYRQTLMPVIKEKLGQNINFLGVTSYLLSLPPAHKGDKVALIFGSGVIQRDGGETAFNELMISSSDTYKTFQLAVEDKDVKAIVYRVNSPGGSPIASETIYGMINYAKDHAKKPVIISMGDAAASGGYWISVAGSKIVAQPATLTGSIGVFGGKYVVSGFLEKLGIKFGNISTSENSSMWSFVQSFTPAQWMKLNALMDDVYQGFSARVAKGRKMTPEQVEKVARGRVWTGEQALALGLVDQLGGLQTAIQLARQEAGLSSDAGIVIYPPQKTFFKSLASLFDHNDEESLHEVGILGTMINPFKKVMSIFHFILSSQEGVYAPLGDVK